MPASQPDSLPESRRLPQSRQLEVESWLHEGEYVLAWFAPDLDDQLRFARGLLVLTDRRLLSLPDKPDVGGSDLRQWRLDEITHLAARDRAGVGLLEAIGASGRLAHWRYTVAVAAGANRLIEHLDRFRLGERSDDEGWGDSEETEEAEEHRPGSAKALLRLFQFATQRGRLVALGFVLTLASTVVGLIPPYLTMPLIDDVLIPYQHTVESLSSDQRREIADAHFQTVLWYLGALAVAAVFAWGLSWAQGIVMAWVSERIGADLRNRTYAHLQASSLEFFSKKRTGDLISRISTDTERICNFLADNVVDFGTDLLVIIGTALVLAWIDLRLALVTLIPLPLVAWVIYRARAQLQHGFQRGGRAWASMTSLLADTIPGIRVVKAFAQEHREIERFHRANEHVLEANDRVNTVWTFFWPLVVLLNQAGLLVVWAYGAWRVLELQITVGVLTTFLWYIRSVYLRLESMSRMMSHVERAGTSAQRIFEILDRAPRTPEPKRPVPCERVRGEVEIARGQFSLRFAADPGRHQSPHSTG